MILQSISLNKDIWIAAINGAVLVMIALVNKRVGETKQKVVDTEKKVDEVHNLTNNRLTKLDDALKELTAKNAALAALVARQDAERESALRETTETQRQTVAGMAIAAAAPPKGQPGQNRATDKPSAPSAPSAAGHAAARASGFHTDVAAATPPAADQQGAEGEKKTFLVETAEVVPGSEVVSPETPPAKPPAGTA